MRDDEHGQMITDVWFRSGLSLREIADRLGLEDVEEDAENYWEWVIGRVGDVRLDLTRTHSRPNAAADARIFPLGVQAFSDALLEDLVRRLRAFVGGPIRCGRWKHLYGNEFERVVIEQVDDDRP